MSRNRFLDGRHVVVTGAGTGIGRAVAVRLGEHGARLTLLARERSRLDETLAQMGAAGEASGAASLDIRDQEATDAAIARAVDERGKLFALVANSGLGGANGPGEGDRFAELVSTNLNGSYHCARAVERHLAAGPEPRHILFMSSILARIGVAGYTGYCASKAALTGLARAFACELAPNGVQVNAIAPGWVDTEMAQDGLQGMADAMGVSRAAAHAEAMKAVPLGRMGQPEEIAGLVAWLLSPDARGVTGQTIDMNGGAWMG